MTEKAVHRMCTPTPAALLYPALLDAAEMHPHAADRILELHGVTWELRQPPEQLHFCSFWTDLSQRLYERRLTTAKQCEAQLWMSWYTTSSTLHTDSYQLYLFGQLIGLGRLYINNTMRLLQLNSGGQHMTRSCISRQVALQLLQQNQHVIHEIYTFMDRHMPVCAVYLQSEKHLWESWRVFDHQYHVLRVQSLWLFSVAGLQEIDASGDADVLRLRQSVVNSLETIAHITATQLKDCEDETLKRTVVHILAGARIESLLCRAEHQKTLNKPRLVCTFYHIAEMEYGWKKDTAAKIYEDESVKRVADRQLEDSAALMGAKPVPVIQPNAYTTGVKWKPAARLPLQ